MQQFFIEDVQNPSLNEGQLHQVKNVLRMRVGDQVRLVDKNGQGIIAEFSDNSMNCFKLIDTIHFHKKSYQLKIVASLIRNERLEWMIQKACECGVDEIVLYSADHGVVKDFGKRSERKMERLNLIALEASEQSYRQYPVKVTGIINKKDLNNEKVKTNLYADVNNHPHILDRVNLNDSLCIIVGPEGGFSEQERKYFAELEFEPVTLGHNIFRAETAPIAIANILSILDKG